MTARLDCFYCNKPVIWKPHHSLDKGQAYNLDRKDPDRGYVEDNIVVCCGVCNTAKSNKFSFEEWQAMTTALRLYRKVGKDWLAKTLEDAGMGLKDTRFDVEEV